MNELILLLGSNVGDRFAYINGAIDLIEENIGKVFRQSSIYETAAFGKEDQNAFLNQIISVISEKSPQELLVTIMMIEKKLGRIRAEKWAERIIDIDILFYGDAIINDNNLIIPHEGIEFRRFTLVPLVEIIGDFVHPKINKNISQMLDLCIDKLEVKMIGKEILEQEIVKLK